MYVALIHVGQTRLWQQFQTTFTSAPRCWELSVAASSAGSWTWPKGIAGHWRAGLALLLTTVAWVCSQRDAAVGSVLHPATPFQAPPNAQVQFATLESRSGNVSVLAHTFPQFGGESLPGRHFRLENTQRGSRNKDSVLVVVVPKDAESWGEGRTADEFLEVLHSFDYPKEKMSVTVLTSSMSVFEVVQKASNDSRGSRCCFETISLWGTLSREKIATRTKCRIENGKDWYEYDLNAWVGRRKVRRSTRDSSFVPGDLSVKRMKQFHGCQETFVPLDSVGGTMLSVKAEVHRQGVLFPVHHVIGSEGYDGIETEGLCYVAHFLGFRCWGMPCDLIYHI
ncbi:hypothetical protein PHYPSEUDO_003459 [Phytophthora pseudosyringae]|uniref:Uncharacterized protein n=1 Tax=Phytophthora pseudosyringae TaxID=221518 RepID=A0A8T1VQL5_9STRA|nr:hypothetical protein PHYPSEUDO_003459 [Phytophthora pseudosyringae]